MASSGPNSPGTLANDAGFGDDAWANAGNAASSNDVYATCAIGGGNSSQSLKATNFGFAIPGGATINGVSCTVERKSSDADTLDDQQPRLVKAGTIEENAFLALGTGGVVPTTDAVATFGGATDLGNTPITLSAAEVNASDFGVAYRMTNTASAATGSVDHITVTVHYTEAAGGKSMSITLTGGLQLLTGGLT